MRKKVWLVTLSEFDHKNFSKEKQLNFIIKEFEVEKETNNTVSIFFRKDGRLVETKKLNKKKFNAVEDTYSSHIIHVVDLKMYVNNESEIEKAKEALLKFYKEKVSRVKERIIIAEKMIVGFTS